MHPDEMKAKIGEAIAGFYQNLRQKKEKAPTRGPRKQSFHAQTLAQQSGQFNRDHLPAPLDYYEQQQGMKLQGRGTWRMTRCPLHDDAHASLSVNIENGAFTCHACQAKGGDVLAFHRLLTGKGFREAAAELGAWEVHHG